MSSLKKLGLPNSKGGDLGGFEQIEKKRLKKNKQMNLGNYFIMIL